MTLRRFSAVLQVLMQLVHRAADLGINPLGGAAARPALQLQLHQLMLPLPFSFPSPGPGMRMAPKGGAPGTSAGLWSCHVDRSIFLLLLSGSFCLCECWLVFMGSRFSLISPASQPDFPLPLTYNFRLTTSYPLLEFPLPSFLHS